MNQIQKSFQHTQQQFCNWIRHPHSDLASVYDHERMQVYRDLVFNNISSFINLVYPITRRLLLECQWQALLQDFVANSKCQSPCSNEIALEFREYYSHQAHPMFSQYPWLAELLQFEWLELYLDTLVIDQPVCVEPYQWQLKQAVWVLVYQYPVYEWTLNTQPNDIQLAPGVIMVWRDEIDQIRLERLSPLFGLLIEHLVEHGGAMQDTLHDLIVSILGDQPNDVAENQLNELKSLLLKFDLVSISVSK